MPDRPSLLLIGHGSRHDEGTDGYWAFLRALRQQDPLLHVGGGFIEFARPNLDDSIDELVAQGAIDIVAVPLILLGAMHLKVDGPDALARARRRHRSVLFRYGRDLGVHPTLISTAKDRVLEALGRDPTTGGTDTTAVVLVGRGSNDPDANSDLYKVARLLSDTRVANIVEPAFISLAKPSVSEALDRVRSLGATTVAVVPYFLFTGVLVQRIHHESTAWAQQNILIKVISGKELGPDARIASLILERYMESLTGDVRMNCDGCIYRPMAASTQRAAAPTGGVVSWTD